jgi:hypothetical protein
MRIGLAPKALLSGCSAAMRRFLRIPRLPAPLRSRLRWLVVGGVLAAMTGNLAWRFADARLTAEAKRQALAGDSAAVVAMLDDWCEHVVPVALTEPGEAGAAARTAAAAKINFAVSRATRGDAAPLQQLAPQVIAAIRLIEGSPTDEGPLGRVGVASLDFRGGCTSPRAACGLAQRSR